MEIEGQAKVRRVKESEAAGSYLCFPKTGAAGGDSAPACAIR